jgi:hypothetical protein
VHEVQIKPAVGRIVSSSPNGASPAVAVPDQDPLLITLPWMGDAQNECLVLCLMFLPRLVSLDRPV